MNAADCKADCKADCTTDCKADCTASNAAAPLRVRMEHARALGYCAAGVREWCAAHGIDYLAFTREGLALDFVLALDDALGQRVAEVALAQAQAQVHAAEPEAAP